MFFSDTPVFPLSIRVPVHIRRTLRVSEGFLPFTGGSGERIDFAANPQSSADVHGYTDRKRENHPPPKNMPFLCGDHDLASEVTAQLSGQFMAGVRLFFWAFSAAFTSSF